MILEYEGFSKSNTMILEEAESISYSYVGIPDEYKKQCEEEFKREVAPKCETSDDYDLQEVDFFTKKLLRHIKQETNCVGIPTLISKKPNMELWNDCSNFILISLFGQGVSSKSYLFELGHKIYILNGSGKTIMKL